MGHKELRSLSVENNREPERNTIMDAHTAAEIMAALGGVVAAPAFDYYGRELLTDDTVKGEPWALVGFPAELVGVTLCVVGQTADGMLVVSPEEDTSLRFRVWPETVTITHRAGAALPVQQDSWWQSVVALRGTEGAITAIQSPFAVNGAVEGVIVK
jgi:hypothetical protein